LRCRSNREVAVFPRQRDIFSSKRGEMKEREKEREREGERENLHNLTEQ
jgi:hypothetical protein